jgi:hypothetical protein
LGVSNKITEVLIDAAHVVEIFGLDALRQLWDTLSCKRIVGRETAVLGALPSSIGVFLPRGVRLEFPTVLVVHRLPVPLHLPIEGIGYLGEIAP